MSTERRNILKEHLVRYQAPDVLVARIRADAEREAERDGRSATGDARSMKRHSATWLLIAAGVLIAAVSSALTFAVTRTRTPDVAQELVASHIRSLMPGHLTDVVSSNQHNVKPWFNGRVDMSPTVPDLSANNFTLVGGRLDYVNGRAVPVVVYSRRAHIINVYEWPAGSAAHRPTTVNGYHLTEWSQSGIECWAVSDLNANELGEFVRAFASHT